MTSHTTESGRSKPPGHQGPPQRPAAGASDAPRGETKPALIFGLNVSTSAAPGADPVADARRAEALGFDFISVNDHLHGDSPTYETWTLLTWIAAATSRIRVASRVLAVPYRTPAVLAKMAETLDRFADGRLILGLGAGASDDEFRAFGLPDRSAGEKIAGLEEAIQIIRGIWSAPQFSFGGAHYRTTGAQVEPKPSHRIPIWLGTFGDRALRVTGRLADGWIPSLGYVSVEQAAVMRARIRRAAARAGRDPNAIACIFNLEIRVDNDAQTAPDVVSGSPEAVVAHLREFIELGFTGFNFIPIGPDPAGQVQRIARDVIPAVRAQLSS